MKITKYEHACLVLEEGQDKLIVDPGMFAKLPDFTGVVAVVITHIHGDHLNNENISRIVANNPSVTVYAEPAVIDELNDLDCKKQSVNGDENYSIGGFNLHLMLDDHAPIYGSSPCKNLRVVVNDYLYYPGDSLVPLDSSIDVIAVPLSAPWSKASDTIDFVNASDAKKMFPTHDEILSEEGKGFYNAWVSKSAEAKGIEYLVLKAGDSI